MRSCTLLLALACAAPSARAATRWTDVFDTPVDAARRRPFEWDGLGRALDKRCWSARDGALVFDTREAPGDPVGLSFVTAGLTLAPSPAFSLEVGFRHVSGAAPRPAYECLAYLRWAAATPGTMRVLVVQYDATARELVLYNADRDELRASADLTGGFHAVRLVSGGGQAALFVDGQPAGAPVTLRERKMTDSEAILLGPVTGGDKPTLHYEYDYLAFADEALRPGEGAWDPAREREPVGRGGSLLGALLDHPPYPGIKVLARQAGRAAIDRARPDEMVRYEAVRGRMPAQLEVPFYTYPDQPGPSRQNVYRSAYPLRCDERRQVAVTMLTRGIDDTREGFMDYKLWYRVSLDGGATWRDEKPLVQAGDGYSPQHPIEPVYIGKNSFCFATIPPTLLLMSNAEVFLPSYYAPLGPDGKYYNPLNAFTFTWVVGLIGRWNAAGDDLLWTISRPVKLEGEQSARGADECGVVELRQPGHLLMVIRGSNQPNPTGKVPAVKWQTLSTDYGRTWSPCTPFGTTEGQVLPSPSSCCSLIRSSRTGRVYWIGNVSRVPPQGNWPRYPLVIGEVDEDKLALKPETVTVIDDREEHDPADLQLSNWNLLEDAHTGRLVLSLVRYMGEGHDPAAASGTWTYEIEAR
ncbi:MAG: hypothetical protein HYU66_14465 [Armatimonadetes bacterium]|nr:hypothetical protein [Armatimonadota bacterium]